MIKSDAQLRQAKSELQDVNQRISEIRQRYSGLELQLLETPLVAFADEIEDQIREYEDLQRWSLEEAVLNLSDEMEPLGNIGKFLSKLRMAAGLTQAQLADELGWQQSNLSRFESETYGSQKVASVVQYASALGVWLYVSPSTVERPRRRMIITTSEEPIQVGWWLTDEPVLETMTTNGLADMEQATTQYAPSEETLEPVHV